ncbi:Tetratricopeptide repeat-containing protein [Solimonas aquatica]|uniref:Tetratricopeptide repeat-containing protein n=1 Tax=Solimonas aquatica TaxID=489703 RepID=A0A1H9DHT5_9GAMM|nr:tetratricopeptide repeat protein [Solimonas aquatica]SEQ12343.1 Tetratricopeptide repeat-containing protein [Solimonas aquatica]
MKRLLPVLLPVILSAGQARGAEPQSTVGSVTQNNGLSRNGHLIVMTPSILRATPSAPQQAELQRAIAEYDALIELPEAPPALRAEALRRAAYLRVWLADVGEQGDGPQLRRAIALYQQLLRELPDDPANDLALYQLARAWQLAGDNAQALTALTQIAARHPQSTLLADAQLRAGELLYAQQRYAEAASQYAAIVARGAQAAGNAPYFGIAQYKYAWSLYRQNEYEPALGVFLAILDRSLPPGASEEPAVLDALAAQQQEFARESLRLAGVCFAALGGGTAMNRYFAAHGEPRYATLLYNALGASLLAQRRYSDAALVYTAFIERHPLHALAPAFQQRVIGAYREGGFGEPLRAAQARYVQQYFPGAAYWQGQAPAAAVMQALRQHLDELGRYYHAQAQQLPPGEDTARRTAFAQAAEAYARLLQLQEDPAQRVAIRLLYADALLDGGQTRAAAGQYLHAAYDQPDARAPEAALAAVQAYQRLAQEVAASERPAALRESLAAAQRLDAAFPQHPQWAAVMTRSAQDLYELHEDASALALAQRVLSGTRALTPGQRSELLAVVADAQYAAQNYPAAEQAYLQALQQNTAEPSRRREFIEHLATAIYRQGEAARSGGDLRAAATAFARVNRLAPGSRIAATADYDAAAALIALKDWTAALLMLEAFRQRYPQHALSDEVDQKLAFAYEQDQQPAAAAQAYARVAAQAATATPLREQAAWQAAQLYERAGLKPAAVRAYENYVAGYPQDAQRGLDARRHLADLARDFTHDESAYRHWLQEIVAVDAAARSAGSQHEAALASLELARLDAAKARSLPLSEPLARSLLARKQATQTAIEGLLRAAAYGDAEVSSAASYEVGAVYRDFGRALLASEKPAQLSGDAAEQYQILLEEQADPFERKSIAAHEANLRRISEGLWNDWVHRSAQQLAELAPALYGKRELREERYEALR